MKKILFSTGITLALCAMFIVPMAIHAQYQPTPVTFDPGSNVQQGSQLGNVGPVEMTANVINVALGVLGLFFLVLLLWGGFIWMNSRGNEEETSKAKKIITGAVIGLAIILTSYGLTYYIFENLVNSTSR
ncbi:pilin [Patescibacteria group bacterium]|nr:pilin [Patescibacteria group bacterium]MBU1672933.1 pilin [Patescibacteria group bacterium]MBU1963351.1 pilin [Patescibacteria group bacterium]